MVGQKGMQFGQIEAVLNSCGLTIRDMIELPPRAEILAPIPTDLLNGPIGSLLRNHHPTGKLWRHQAVALDHIHAGRNVVVATATASGKSRVFQYAALHAALKSGLRTLVLYPVKALAADQFTRWQGLIDELDLPDSAVVKIDGGVDPAARADMLNHAKVVLMTPDVCHSWLMRKVDLGAVRDFLQELQYVVLDEAHVYDGIFGSNTAFMLRRLISAKLALFPDQSPLQFIATTATIQNPGAQMELLVGQPFELVGEADDGSPSHLRRLYLVTSSDLTTMGEAVLSDLLVHLAPVARANERRMIAFHDSRQGTERVAIQVAAPDIHAYRSGYEEHDRVKIENALQGGQILGIVSTSAMELGIDVPGLDIGLNLGIPRTRKQFRQRFGRIGRSDSGAFILVANEQAIRNLPGDLQTYLTQAVEPSYLYLGNRFMQFTHARCMHKEIKHSGLPKMIALSQPGLPVWPVGFDQQMVNATLPDKQLDQEFHVLAARSKWDPHLSFPLRLLGEINFELRPPGRGKAAPPSGNDRIGNISIGQALREAYPGATYRHLSCHYYVRSWQEGAPQPSITVEKRSGLLATSPILERELSFCRDHIINGRLLMAPGGYVAETELVVVETVQGYEQSMPDGEPKRRIYKPEQRKRREIRTTGVVVAFDDDVLNGAMRNAGALHEMGEALKACFLYRHQVEPNDVELSVGECALVGPEGPKSIASSIVIYDAAYGGMRLTEKLFEDFLTKAVDDCFGEHMLERFQSRLWPSAVLQSILKWMRALKSQPITALPAPTWPDHVTTFFAPGSIVSMFVHGRYVERQLGDATMQVINGQSQLCYEYTVTNGTGTSKQLAPANVLRPTGHQWSVVTRTAGTS